MGLLIIGLALFVGVHLVPASPALRGALLGRLGTNGYKAAFSLLSGLGVVLIVMGYRAAPNEPIFEPSDSARGILPFAMAVAFVLMATAYAPGHIRRLLRHPMLASILIWAVLHLLANGDLASNILFGTFSVWTIFAILSAERRGQKLGGERMSWRADAIAGLIGLTAYAAALYLHGILFGVSPIQM